MNDNYFMDNTHYNDQIHEDDGNNTLEKYDENLNNKNDIFVQNKVGRLISEKYLSEFINEDIFFIGEIINQHEDILTLKSVNGNCVECIIKDANFQPQSKYIGIKGIVSNNLKVLETRGIVFLDDVNFEIVNDYIDINIKNANSDVFLCSY
ncbi:hypothetical protein YYC_00837 [Plasmodium yoelii 17X]|uniref:Nucleic acid-binding protein n=3 Tax=Plasmodium yoelii TaxID=5861 RepID=A0AAE9WSF6_PLAYO|nr:conserved Plasmodium protein, unknown function [Plasmodium yoelii]ETB62223.1 hypothetical protein YYC_00837 [Plasmodium yoelii 17X]WBY59242.1 nucleic acid-binding protein [Plasmodium yoelii yoelii]CDU19398.1 conserved Plasmodium protein, unknown function [Plasmodium yoelii]VTZ80033.1 conserved Plasmodium protein, unknown function [Plasmodium yoelii]|eukprot:XP_729855.2 conserved Plasmodium protein, unknown function [Plasmodium yoelii]